MKTAIFLERDGVLNLARVERQHQLPPETLKEFQVIPEALPALAALKAAGFLLIVTTNQPGLSRGTLSRRELDAMHAVLRKTFPLDDILVCPHDESDACSCRKPEPGLLTEAAFKWHIELENSYVVSDKWQDARVARAIACTSMLLQSPWIGHGHHDFVLPNLPAIADKILRLQANRLAA